jgi:hypothetical protein
MLNSEKRASSGTLMVTDKDGVYLARKSVERCSLEMQIKIREYFF